MLIARPVLLLAEKPRNEAMTRAVFAVVAALAPIALVQSQALGVEAPWCAVTKEGDHWDCRTGPSQNVSRTWSQAIVAGAIRTRTSLPRPPSATLPRAS